VSLARAEVGTASGAAFFICIGDQPGLDYGGMRNPDGEGFAAFGKVLAGMDIVHAIHQQEARGASESPYTEGQMLTAPVRLVEVRRTNP
jgi:peptidyl-prolyl cis-trans isomerase A (cyclophilin A)